MILKKFETFIDPIILERGEDYYEWGYVTRLRRKNKMWSAIVSGRENYEVEIRLSGRAVDAYSCDCPHDANVCKHIVATLFAIRRSRLPANPKSKKTTAASGSPGKALYSNMIRKAIRVVSLGTGFIEYDETRRFRRRIDRLLGKSNAAFRNGKYADAVDIAFAVIEGVLEVVGSSANNGAMSVLVDRGFRLLERLIAEDLPVSLRRRILKDAVKASKNPDYGDYGFEDHWQKIIHQFTL